LWLSPLLGSSRAPYRPSRSPKAQTNLQALENSLLEIRLVFVILRGIKLTVLRVTALNTLENPNMQRNLRVDESALRTGPRRIGGIVLPKNVAAFLHLSLQVRDEFPNGGVGNGLRLHARLPALSSAALFDHLGEIHLLQRDLGKISGHPERPLLQKVVAGFNPMAVCLATKRHDLLVSIRPLLPSRCDII